MLITEIRKRQKSMKLYHLTSQRKVTLTLKASHASGIDNFPHDFREMILWSLSMYLDVSVWVGVIIYILKIPILFKSHENISQISLCRARAALVP